MNTMARIRIISTSSIEAPSHIIGESPKKIHLTPWDLRFLKFDMNQEGLLFHNPINVKDQIQQLKHSLSSSLAFFPPLTGRLVILEHEFHIASSYILCNNAGALFVHAIADNTYVADILQSNYVPPILYSFFPCEGVKNYEGTSQPLLAVQVTELVDGIFIGFAINHVVADGRSFFHFINSWAEISRGCDKISQLPAFERWFIDSVDPPIKFYFIKEEEKKQQSSPVRIFHLTKEKIAHLKSKANKEANTNKISSQQALLSHIWHVVIRTQKHDPQEETYYLIAIDFRGRTVPPLAKNYFGNGVEAGVVNMKVGELLEGGIGKGAWEMHKMIDSHSYEKLKSQYESWLRTPNFVQPIQASMHGRKFFFTGSSLGFNVYDNDFGWGKPVAYRSGNANNYNGKIGVAVGVKEGSIDVHVSLPHEILEDMGKNPHIMDFMECSRLKAKL
ncbi:hypothetical protein RIF29_21635 [Crotalaria pallida]|uniref:Uncharacterized protein n=1 Tax=Crotalaria pallida TaxID=3830 RepID=A0AAN9F5P2_CROPI